MKPEEPLHKIRHPREFADKTGARPAEPLMIEPGFDEAPVAGASARPSMIACPLCEPGQVPAVHDDMIALNQYQTAQPDLLAGAITATHPELLMETMVHRECLVHIERELQRAQIIRGEHGPQFIDLALGPVPILPTSLRMEAEESLTGRGVTIAFVDSGFYPHPDLMEPQGRVLALYDAVMGREVRSIRRLAGRRPPVQAWHGTMAAATAAGSGYCSGGDYRGIASNARLVLVRAMTRQYRIRTPQVVRALEWIQANRERYGIRVVNLSLGVDETTDSLEHPVIALVEQLSAQGVVIVAASGNNPSVSIKPPGAAPSAITVGGYNDYNSTSWMRRELWHSSYGRTPGGARKPELLGPAIWVAAPILPNTAVKEAADALFQLACAGDEELMEMIPRLAGRTGIAGRLTAATGPVHARSIVLARIAEEKLITPDYKHVDGTSFAAPIVSSVVAQMLEARPYLRPDEVKEILTTTALLLPGVAGDVQGSGLVAPGRAIAATLSLPERRTRSTGNS